ncbi:serine recombinase [Longimycelium tulufanense]|uniref:Serine recombinase n=1 Tax=Longimycelium tulufanense TaxID=907463 RepID=A0A8J3FVN9_9PSEU|nr:recombinase family protein [Longimycelium tulufanense]GGM65006.1 serine recombinase [Longimycelium tulufanense]
MTRKAIIYVRISQDREGAGLGVERQEADCRELANRLGWTVVDVCKDNDVSAYSGKPRKGYRRLLADLEAGKATGVLTWHTDRLHRSPAELETYIDVCEGRGIVTHTVKAGYLDLSTPSGRMVARQLGAVARFESEHKGERIRRARRQAAQAGRWQGGARPFGFEADGETVRADEAAEIAKATDAILAGATLRSVVRDLNERGFRTTFGKDEWTTIAFKDVLLRPRNAGLMVYRGEIVGKAAWPAIVPEEKWRALVSKLKDPARRSNLGSSRVKWFGSGLYVCGVCNLPRLRVSTCGAQKKPAYRCTTRERGRQSGHVTRVASNVDNVVERLIVARLQRRDAVDLVNASKADTVDATALHAEAMALSQRLEELSALFAEGAITAIQLKTGTDKLRARLQEIDAELASAGEADPLVGIIGAPNVAEIWFGTKPDRSDGLSLGRRRAILDTLLTVTVLPTGVGRRPGGSYFDPNSLDIFWKR